MHCYCIQWMKSGPSVGPCVPHSNSATFTLTILCKDPINTLTSCVTQLNCKWNHKVINLVVFTFDHCSSNGRHRRNVLHKAGKLGSHGAGNIYKSCMLEEEFSGAQLHSEYHIVLFKVSLCTNSLMSQSPCIMTWKHWNICSKEILQLFRKKRTFF